jgi:hypothetical protein
MAPAVILCARDAHRHRVLEVLGGDAGDAWRHGGREERGLPLGRRGVEDLVQVLLEAHVEHLVGLVEHEDLEVLELERAAADVVERAAGRGDHHVDAAAQGAQLLLHGGAAVHGQHRDAEAAAVLVDGLRHLHGQLARGHEHERGGLDRRAVVEAVGSASERDALQQRERERGGLAGAGGRLAEEVASLDERRDGLALDGRGLLVAQTGERRHELGAETERGERGPAVVGRGGA